MKTAISSAQIGLDQELRKFLTFFLAEKTFAISILKIREIIEYGKVIDVPMMPEFICGAINLRGKVVPIIDLAVRLGGQHSEISKRSCIVVVEMKTGEDSRNVGLVVDSVSRVVDFQIADIDPAPSFGGNVNTDFIEGMGKTQEGFIIMLNIDRVLSMEDLQKLDEIKESDATRID